MSSILLRAPRTKLRWTASGAGASFKAYRIYSRPSRTPAQAWTLHAELTVPDGYTAATVEAQHTAYDAYQAGWTVTGGEWPEGWDWAMTSVTTAGLEDVVGTFSAARVPVPDPGTPWIVSDTAPYLNCPVEILQDIRSTLASDTVVTRYAGRDRFATRTPAERPGRAVSAAGRFFAPVGPDQLRSLRAAARAGVQVALLMRNGDRVLGSLDVTGFGGERVGRQVIDLAFYETAETRLPNHNLPAAVVLNGTTQYVTTPDAADLNPGSAPFTVVVAAVFAGSAGSDYALSKGDLGTADGYGLRTSAVANELQFFVDGASAAGGPTDTSAVWFDGNVHVAVGTSSGTGQALYRDGVSVATSAVTHGAVTNAVALVAGANNAGASGHMAARIQTVAVYLRELTAAEAQTVSYALAGYANQRMPAGAALLWDARDNRTWSGFGSTWSDLTGTHVGTLTASPATRGIPWNLAQAEVV